MDPKEMADSSGSPPEMSVPGKTSTGGTTYVTLPDPRETRSAQVSSSRPVKELRTTDAHARTESTRPATHPESPKIPRTPGPASPATRPRTSTDTVEHSTQSQGTDLAEKSPGFGTQSTPGPASVAASASSGSRTWELTSDASGESLTPTTIKENTVTSWLWALTSALPVATGLSTRSTEDTASAAPDISSPSSSKTTFATQRYQSLGDKKQHRCVCIQTSRPPQPGSQAELISTPPRYSSIDRAHVPSSTHRFDIQEGAHTIRGSKTGRRHVSRSHRLNLDLFLSIYQHSGTDQPHFFQD
ncbi:polycystin-1-like protein 3 [Mirounga angustirostris]|uniref:polycystin-1-like protein 3 n=1 Tax=Mirounga angustirostris TaxID=9716 RepID=UPI00313D128B